MIHGGFPLKVPSWRLLTFELAAPIYRDVAEGTTTVGKLTHLDRGYYQFHEKLAKLGANISRVRRLSMETQRLVFRQLLLVLSVCVIGLAFSSNRINGLASCFRRG